MTANIYLAGPITGLTFGACTDWRDYMTNKFPKHIKGQSPMRGKEYLSKERTISDQYVGSVLSCQKGITTRDRWDTSRCDAIVVNLLGATRVTIGTMIEIGWADAFRKPIILIMEEEGNLHDHSMVRECAGFIVRSVDEAINVLTTMFKE